MYGMKVFDEFCESVNPGRPGDLGRRRIIPEYLWESVAAPNAGWMDGWMDVDASPRETVQQTDH